MLRATGREVGNPKVGTAEVGMPTTAGMEVGMATTAGRDGGTTTTGKVGILLGILPTAKVGTAAPN